MIGTGDFVNRHNISGSAEILDLAVTIFGGTDFPVSQSHSIIETGAYQIQLIRPSDDFIADPVRGRLLCQRFNGGNHMLTPHFIKAPLHPSESHMGQVADPFKIGNSDTTGIDEGIGQDGDALFPEYLVGLEGYWAVGRFKNQPGLDIVGIYPGDLRFHRRWYEYVTFHFQDPFAVLDESRIRKALDGFIVIQELPDFLHRQSALIN